MDSTIIFIGSLINYLSTIDITTETVMSIVSFHYFTIPILLWLILSIKWGYELAFYGFTSPRQLKEQGLSSEIDLTLRNTIILMCTTMLTVALALILNGVGYHLLELTGWSERWTDALLQYTGLKE